MGYCSRARANWCTTRRGNTGSFPYCSSPDLSGLPSIQQSDDLLATLDESFASSESGTWITGDYLNTEDYEKPFPRQRDWITTYEALRAAPELVKCLYNYFTLLTEPAATGGTATSGVGLSSSFVMPKLHLAPTKGNPVRGRSGPESISFRSTNGS